MQKVLMVLASKDFRGEEYAYPREILEKAGLSVVVASSKKGAIKSAPWGLALSADATLLLEEVNVEDYSAVVFVGGNGAKEYFGNAVALGIARKALEKGKVLGAICIAPVILARAGVLRGRKATVFPGDEKELEKGGASPQGEEVIVDGKIITANGPGAAVRFGEMILALLS